MSSFCVVLERQGKNLINPMKNTKRKIRKSAALISMMSLRDNELNHKKCTTLFILLSNMRRANNYNNDLHIIERKKDCVFLVSKAIIKSTNAVPSMVQKIGATEFVNECSSSPSNSQTQKKKCFDSNSLESKIFFNDNLQVLPIRFQGTAVSHDGTMTFRYFGSKHT